LVIVAPGYDGLEFAEIQASYQLYLIYTVKLAG